MKVTTKWLGSDHWIKKLTLLEVLRQYADDLKLQNEFHQVRKACKTFLLRILLAEYWYNILGLSIQSTSYDLFTILWSFICFENSDMKKAKILNKKFLIRYLKEMIGTDVPVNALFDVQIKRIYEYKRQLLNLMGEKENRKKNTALHAWFRLKSYKQNEFQSY